MYVKYFCYICLKQITMKVQVKEESKKFEPITLEINIESEQELCSLWHRMNVNAIFVNEDTNRALKHPAISNKELWDELNVLVNSRNLIR